MTFKKIIYFVILIGFVISINNTYVYAQTSNSNISIDGYLDDWSDKPLSYEYNWDNSKSCWYWGEWYNNICYKTPIGTYDNNVRHIMQLFVDDEYVYLHIKFATIYGSLFNGEDYQVKFDGSNSKLVKIQIADANGNTLTNNVKNFSPGVYKVYVRRSDSSFNNQIMPGSEAKLTVYNNYLNTDLELKLPLSECLKQNKNKNSYITDLESVSFFSPNLMYRRIVTHGTSTGPILLIGLCLLICIFFMIKRKRKGN
jgi:uncharacterized protein (TIGR04145 family)